MTEHTVNQGECINSIANEYGFLWQTIWKDGANAALGQLRKDPSVLNPGDIVQVPEKPLRFEEGQTEKRHHFRRKGAPAKVKIQIKRNDEPRANVPYTLEIDGKSETGKTDGQGMVEMKISPSAVRGKLRVGIGEDAEVFPFRLGAVDPIDTESGARQRLRCLGYDADQDSFEDLLTAFQGKENVEPSGKLDGTTQTRLQQRFGE